MRKALYSLYFFCPAPDFWRDPFFLSCLMSEETGPWGERTGQRHYPSLPFFPVLVGQMEKEGRGVFFHLRRAITMPAGLPAHPRPTTPRRKEERDTSGGGWRRERRKNYELSSGQASRNCASWPSSPPPIWAQMAAEREKKDGPPNVPYVWGTSLNTDCKQTPLPSFHSGAAGAAPVSTDATGRECQKSLPSPSPPSRSSLLFPPFPRRRDSPTFFSFLFLGALFPAAVCGLLYFSLDRAGKTKIYVRGGKYFWADSFYRKRQFVSADWGRVVNVAESDFTNRCERMNGRRNRYRRNWVVLTGADVMKLPSENAGHN